MKSSRASWGGGQFRKNSLNPCKIRKTDKINNIIFKDVKEFNIILLILIGIFLVSISGYSSYAIFTDEIVSNNEIKGVVRQKKTPPNPSKDTSGANVPVLTNNMIPVYYDESDNNWKKADKQTAWYNYDEKQWANAVTLYSDGGYKYNSKVSANTATSINGSYCSADVVDINDRPTTGVTEEVITNHNEVNIDYTNEVFYTSYDGEPSGTYIPLQNIYVIDSSAYDFECGFDYENNTIGDLQSIVADGSEIIIDIMNEYVNSYGFFILRFFDDATGENTIYFFEGDSTIEEVSGTYKISPLYYTIQENTTYEEYSMGSSFTFDEETGIYNLSDTINSTLTNDAVGKYMCDNKTSSCTKMYKINTVSNYRVTNADVYEVEKTKIQTNELTLADGSKKACSSSICTRNDYINAPSGTVIPMRDINAMFVWIPRYKYTYFASNTPTEIPITFEIGTASTGTIKCTDAINYNGTNTGNTSETCTDTTNGSIIKGKSTYTHPAFTFGDKNLTGIWVGKFENSEGNNITIKPDIQSTRNINVSTMFQYARNMELVNNIYGFSQSGTTLNTYTGVISGDSNNLDTHMMKNMEWGAVAYLSHSKYGMNGEVYVNNSKNYYTGRSGGNVGGSTPINGTYTNQTPTEQYNTYGFYTYDGYLLNYDTNTKSTTRDLSKVASTTGNIYGVYDMSGGASEYVMGNMQDSSNAFNPVVSGIWSTTNKPLDKYYDKYSYGNSSAEYTRGKLGDATIEMQLTGPTGNWHKDYTSFFHAGYSGSDASWFQRGGYYGNGTSAGLFHFISGAGDARLYYGSRVVLSVTVP